MNEEINKIEYNYSQISEEAILLEKSIQFGNETLNTIEAIKIALKERNLNYIISVENSDKNLISINNFLIKLIFTGIYADEVEINKRDFKIDKSNPHFVLLVQIDDDYDYVFIKGLLTNEQFQKLIPSELNFKDSFNTKIESFNGGINRFFTYIQILNPISIETINISSSNLSDKIISKAKRKIRSFLELRPFEFLDKNLFINPLGVGIFPVELSLVSSLRSSNQLKEYKISLLSPTNNLIEYEKEATCFVKINKPTIYILEPIKRITLIINESVVWENDDINEPINWPCKSIQKDENIILRITPLNAKTGFGKTIKIILDSDFADLDNIIKNLFYDYEWIREIKRNIGKNNDLMFALLFSESAPSSKTFIKFKNKLINNFLN